LNRINPIAEIKIKIEPVSNSIDTVKLTFILLYFFVSDRWKRLQYQ
jgi:hypothetical protein